VNLPTVLTVSRILMVPFFIAVAGPYPLVGVAVFSAASLTDLLDGYLARRYRQITKLGIILDPLADKFLVIAALIVLVDLELVAAWIAIVIIIREFLVTGLRLVALAQDMVIPAETGGKFKTGFQITAIIVYLVDYSRLLDPLELDGIGLVTIVAALVLGVISGVQYFLRFAREW